MEQAARKQLAETVVVKRIDVHRWYLIAVLDRECNVPGVQELESRFQSNLR